tara:strand:+ start:927 stop:2423 length:1497 start_codon:yes stop_codon:yes gene_type:complete
MANKSFGTKQLDLTGASGSPIITSPSDLSINATTVAISTNISVGGYFASNVNVGAGYSVGIGTTIPTAKLEVRGDIRLRRTASDDGGIFFGATDNNYIFGSDTDDLLTFATNGSERLRIESGGDLKISSNIKSSDSDFYVYSYKGGSDGQVRAGVQYDGTSQIVQFFTATNERLRIGSTGNVGIGSESPQTKLDVNGGLTVKALNINTSGAGDGDLLSNGGSDGTFGIFNTTDSGDILFSLKDSGGTPKEKLRIIGATDTTFAASDDITLNQGGGVPETTQVTGVINMGTSYLNSTHTAGSGHYGAVKLHLYKSRTGTNAQTIDNVYGLGVSNGMMEIQSNAFIGFFAGTSGAGTGTRPLRMVMDTNGNIGVPGNTSIIYNASDSRLKKNVVTLDKGLSEINSLRPVSFSWIDGYCQNDRDKLYGFLAQEVQTVDSNLVSTFGTTPVGVGTDPLNPTQTITDPLAVDEKFIVPMLVKAVQELSAKNDALEARIAALEG